MRGFSTECAQRLVFVGLIAVLLFISFTPARAQTNNYEFTDSHFHLTDNIQEGPSIRDFLGMMGSKAGRVAVFGVPLQHEWSYRVDGDRAPTYLLALGCPSELLLLHGRMDCHGLQVLGEGTAGPF
jgi:hypothetical protein